MRAARNIAIILLLALVVYAVPGGGNAADGIFAFFSIAFLTLIGGAAYTGYRQNRLAYLTLTEQSQMILLAALGAIVFVVAGADELLDTGAGLLVFVGILGFAVMGIVRVVQEARSL